MSVATNETERLRALRELNLLNTAPSESFDRITRIASQFFNAPISAVSLTDEDRQWFKSRVGCGTEIPRDQAPCAEVTRTSAVLVVSDLTKDPRFQTGVLAQSGVRFYAGAPLVTREGFALGAMCVLDTEPRTVSASETKILTDLAAMVMAQVELQHALGRIDPASGLPNRNQFADDLEDAKRDHDGEARVAVLIDLAEPGQLSQAARVLGPAYLDALIKTTVVSIKSLINPGTTLYQVGATQFAAVLNGHDQDAIRVAFSELLMILQTTVRDAGLAASVAVGLAPFTLGQMSAGDVLRAAQSAAHDAREAQPSIGAYSSSADEVYQRRYSLVEDLRAALSSADQLSLVYQPRIDAHSGDCIGAEALLRWAHPLLGTVPPGEFIPLAEQTELARPVTEWVISKALRQLVEWREMGIDLRLSVNVSASNLEEDDFSERLGISLKQYGVAPQALEIEFTESALIRNRAKVLKNLTGVRALKITCAIDDFGTGYSSFSYLQDIPADIIKIDQSFVRTLTAESRGSALVRNMISMGHELGYRVVAEGVETQEARDFLASAGCDELQGYFIARPLQAAVFSQWVRDQRSDAADHRQAA